MQEEGAYFLSNGRHVTTDVESLDTVFLNFITIIFKYHMSSVIFDTFLFLLLSSKVKPHVAIVD